MIVTGAVEGDLDEALLKRLATHVGLSLEKVYGRQGKPALLRDLAGYNNAARFSPWIVLVDLDGDFDCAPNCVQYLLPEPSANMCFRIAVRAAEAWILGDRQRVAEWLGISLANLPEDPDAVADPKQTLVNLARRSRRSSIQNDLVPREGSGRSVGQLYTSRMIEFIRDADAGWRPDEALVVSNSLGRCIARLEAIADACRRAEA